MRAFAFLALVSLGAADLSTKETASCVVDGGAALDELMDASIYIWAADKRCASGAVQCTIDVSSAVESVLAMIKIVLKVADKCGDLHGTKCGTDAVNLAHAVAGITASSAELTTKCPHAVAAPASWHHAGPAMCVVDLKDTFRSLFKAIKGFMHIKKDCKDGSSKKCTSTSLKIVSAFVGLGEYMAGVVGHCTNIGDEANCASEAARLVHHLVNLGKAGTDMARHCEEDDAPPTVVDVPVTIDVGSRLYSDDADGKATGVNANLVLGAFLPVTAIVSFVGGRFFASRRSRATQTREVTPEEEPLA